MITDDNGTYQPGPEPGYDHWHLIVTLTKPDVQIFWKCRKFSYLIWLKYEAGLFNVYLLNNRPYAIIGRNYCICISGVIRKFLKIPNMEKCFGIGTKCTDRIACERICLIDYNIIILINYVYLVTSGKVTYGTSIKNYYYIVQAVINRSLIIREGDTDRIVCENDITKLCRKSPTEVRNIRTLTLNYLVILVYGTYGYWYRVYNVTMVCGLHLADNLHE